MRTTPSSLFPDSFFKKLARLRLSLKERRFSTLLPQRGPSLLPGPGEEFREHRNYSPGDDLRYLDWNLYARSNELFVKDYYQEQGKRLCIVLDNSASMKFARHYDLARQLAGGMAYLALQSGLVTKLVLTPQAIAGKNLFYRWSEIPYICRQLEKSSPQGSVPWSDHLQRLQQEPPSFLYIISDLLHFGGHWKSLQKISYRHQCLISHLLYSQEAKQLSLGRHRLRDSETGNTLLATITPEIREQYQENSGKFSDTWRYFCWKNKIHYQQVSPTTPAEQSLLHALSLSRWL